MSKIPGARGADKRSKRQPRIPAGLPENQLGGLRKRLNDPDALARFVGALSEKDRKVLRRDYQKLPLKRQEEIYLALVDLAGPAAVLHRELLKDLKAWADGLPTPQDEPPILSEDELREIYVGAGFSDEDARERAAKEVKRPSDEVLREAYGDAPSEVIEEVIADHKRQVKIDAASELTRPAVSASKKRDAQGKLRSLANESWKRAQRIAVDARHLAWCLYEIDEIKNGERGGLEPIRTQWAESEWAEFRETVSAGANLSDVLEALCDVTELLAREMKALDGELSKSVGRPKDDVARLAAEPLREIGLTPTQTAEILERAELANYEVQYVGQKGRRHRSSP